ncbi:DUF342 domain-containing protein [Sinanaerobacter chloroacetimidivorans]|uniref:DUF342 domain-containing protein n=1 Tax=Sinanaerobacter chloroacetimidivorans TaxID=2818044 RepID=A0A8J7VYQ3_9FIRM|nr:FapA family protein [Sinanaerobacter chloroacetimidivorans]MBR0597552.1 DUF342 domain-containing protein [Sinanaerobacter chloroacetimidivorans]
MSQNETPDIMNLCKVEVLISEDCMIGYVKLTKGDEGADPITKEQILEALHSGGIVYGIKESSVEKLAMRPIYNIKIEVARGLYPEHGEDGVVTFYIKRDSEYQPDYDMDGIVVDYKNLDYFQLVKKDQLLCEIKKETEGVEGVNIFGAAVPAKRGKTPPSPVGKNTILTENETKLVATCDGVVRFLRDTIDINDMLKITTNVDQQTGNIHFTGDVTVDGDVCDGFSVKSGGNLIVKGVVEDAIIEADGNVLISKGINGGGKSNIVIHGDLRCKYIENAIIHVDGSISADYIIDSKITCMGDITLSGSNELVVGGEIKLLGELKAKDIGSEKERITKIEVLGVKMLDEEAIKALEKERDESNEKAQALIENASKINQLIKMGGNSELIDQLTLIRRQILALKEQIDHKTFQIEKLQDEWNMEYHGQITCKRKLYQGVKILFGETRFRFDLDNLDHCRIYWHEGEIIQGVL